MELRVNQSADIELVIENEISGVNLGMASTEAVSITHADGTALLSGSVTALVALDGAVKLPAGTRLDAIRVAGANLVVTLSDGQVFVIVDGALHPPQFILGTIKISPSNVAALIASQGPEPAHAVLQSSGSNFAETPGDISDPFQMGDPLLPTEFTLAAVEDEELIPAFLDEEPEITIVTLDQPLGSVEATGAVSEAALPAHGSQPSGSATASTGASVVGTILISSINLPNVVAVNGTTIKTVGQTIVTPFGVLTITHIAQDSIGYSYMLAQNSSDAAPVDVITVTITDGDGDVATATLSLSVTDDVATARDDTENVAPNLFHAQAGNVITGVGTASGLNGADTVGADNATVTGIRNSESTDFLATGSIIQGQYGKLLMLPNGSYSYVRATGTPGGVADIFTYELTDGDGDTSTATLTINIGDSAVRLLVPSAGDEGTVVDEAGLSERSDEAAGSRDGDGSNLSFGVINFNAPDGPAIITINGVAVTDVYQEIEFPTGTMVIVAIGSNTLEYAFVLNDNVIAGISVQPITVTVADQDGDIVSASFEIEIVDDAPRAVSDVDVVVAGSNPDADGNVLSSFGGSDANNNDGAADVKGADGAAITRVSFAGSYGHVGGVTSGTYGTLTLNADGSYRYTLGDTHPDIVALGETETLTETFEYTLTDADDDHSIAILTITIRGHDDVVTISGLNPDQAEVSVSAANLSDGSAPDIDALTLTGSFEFSDVDGLVRLEIDGELLFDGKVADSAFATNFADTTKRTALPMENSALGTALAAAAFVAALPPTAQDQLTSVSESPLLTDEDPIRTLTVEPLTVERVDDADIMAGQFNVQHPDHAPALSPSILKVDSDGYTFHTSVHSDQAFEMGGNGPGHAETIAESYAGLANIAPWASDAGKVFMPPSNANSSVNADEIKVIVADAIEGKSIDVDSIVAAYAGSSDISSTSAISVSSLPLLVGDEAYPTLGNLFMPDMAEMHLTVQIEQVAITGHA